MKTDNNFNNLGVARFALIGLLITNPVQAVEPIIAPINSVPYGQTYGRWAAEWLQWAYSVPKAKNPLTDTTGKFCTARQVDKVWFLAGFFGTPQPIKRTCKIPRGRALFFPLIQNGYGAFLNDPPATRTQNYVRSAASCTLPTQITVKIDGIGIPSPNQYFTGASGSQSPFFNVQMPNGNLFDLTELEVKELVLSPTAEQGYYLFVNPLSVGSHTIRWTATGCFPGGSQDISYQLTIV